MNCPGSWRAVNRCWGASVGSSQSVLPATRPLTAPSAVEGMHTSSLCLWQLGAVRTVAGCRYFRLNGQCLRCNKRTAKIVQNANLVFIVSMTIAMTLFPMAFLATWCASAIVRNFCARCHVSAAQVQDICRSGHYDVHFGRQLAVFERRDSLYFDGIQTFQRTCVRSADDLSFGMLRCRVFAVRCRGPAARM